MKVNQKHVTLLRTQFGPSSGRQEQQAVANSIKNMSETEQEQYSAFMQLAGQEYTALILDLDVELEKLADVFPDETDPRKWDADDFLKFEAAIAGHEYENLWRTYAMRQSNLHLVWEKVLERIAEL